MVIERGVRSLPVQTSTSFMDIRPGYSRYIGIPLTKMEHVRESRPNYTDQVAE